MSDESDSAPSLFSAKALVEYRANIFSNFNPMDSCFGEGIFYCFFGVHGLRLIKNITPLWVSPVRKKAQASEWKRAMLHSTTKAHL
jgi:heme/copper-type cytochrome/quinol oxidase subunit 3